MAASACNLGGGWAEWGVARPRLSSLPPHTPTHNWSNPSTLHQCTRRGLSRVPAPTIVANVWDQHPHDFKDSRSLRSFGGHSRHCRQAARKEGGQQGAERAWHGECCTCLKARPPLLALPPPQPPAAAPAVASGHRYLSGSMQRQHAAAVGSGGRWLPWQLPQEAAQGSHPATRPPTNPPTNVNVVPDAHSVGDCLLHYVGKSGVPHARLAGCNNPQHTPAVGQASRPGGWVQCGVWDEGRAISFRRVLEILCAA